MNIAQHPFQTIDWSQIPKEIHQGEQGEAYWQVMHMGPIRIRMVEYTAGYVADHWCNKGHVILCVKGEMSTALQDGRTMLLTEGMTYMVGDDSEAHRTSTATGCVLFIVD